METKDIRGLMEAYSQVYETPEVLNEEVVEEDAEVLDEQGRNRTPQATIDANRRALGNTLLYGNPEGRFNRVTTPRQRQRNRTSTPPRPVANLPADYKQTELRAGAAAERSRPGAGLPVSGGGNQGSNRPATSTTSTTPRSTSSAAPKPAAPQKSSRQQELDSINADKSLTPMQKWAKANPKLAAAKAERDRTRGTNQTTNPLMKDMRSRLPDPKTAQSPTLAKDLGKSSGNQALLNNPNVPKADKVNKTDGGPADNRVNTKLRKEDLDIFDLVKGHLLDEGYAETEQAAMTIMANMSEEWRRDILESYGVQNEGYAVTIEDIVKLLDENREHEREMRKAAARERAEEKKEKGKKSAKAPGRLGKSAGSSYADYQEVSIKAHDKATKGKYIPGMVKNEESLDIFDMIAGYLLDEGYADTEEDVLSIMANMSEEWRQDILEFLGGQSGDGYLGHPRLGIKNPFAKKQTNTRTSAGGGPDVASTGRNIGNIRSRQEDMIRQTLGR